MNRRTKHKLEQVAGITVLWLLIGLFVTIYDHVVLHSAHSSGPSAEYSFLYALSMGMISTLLGSILGGSFLVFYVNEKYHDKPYAYTILAVAAGYLLVMLTTILIVGSISTTLESGLPISHPDSQKAFKIFLINSSSPLLLWSVVVTVTQLLLQMSSKFGHGAFVKILFGRYNTPREETKIFMFLDLNSSTALAEQFGNKKYHQLLKDFFADITNPILNNGGEIYQYVGDEVIVVWNYNDGIENAKCVNCFFDIKSHLENKKEKYLKRYGLLPTFKAGIHCGEVVAGEVGIIKRDITYSGDVLNTTSRMLGMCKDFDIEIITSSEIASEIDLCEKYVIKPLGSIKLKGKEKEVQLCTLTY